MTTLEEKLEEAAKQEDRVKQVDLVNQTFTIHSARMIDFKDADGNDKQSMVAMIAFDGAEPVEAWMDGVKVRPQIHVLQAESAFPVNVKLVKDGQAYKLILIAQLPAANGSPAQKEAVAKQGSGSTVKDALTAFDAARTAMSDDELSQLLGELEIEYKYDGDGHIVIGSLTVVKALALKKALA